MMENSSLMYLTRADPHDVARNTSPLSSQRLRTYLMFYGLFFENLITGDSQFINNSRLRSLLWPNEPGAEPGVRADLAVLLDRQVLFPAIRDSAGTLHDVWSDLVARGVPEAGSESYIDFVQEHLGSQASVIYQLSSVSSFFRDQVLAIFAHRGLALKASVRQSVYDFVMSQDPFYYIRLRQWMELAVEQGTMTERQRDLVDLAVASAYRHNVPMAIDGAQIDIPLDHRKFWSPIDIELSFEGKVNNLEPEYRSLDLRPFSVSPYVLGRLPAETLLAIRDDPARRPVFRHLDKFQRTGQFDAEKFSGELERYLLNAEEIAYEDAYGDLRELIRRRRRERRRANITMVRDVGLAVAGLSIWREVGDVAGYTGLVVTAWASLRNLRRRDWAYRNGQAAGRRVPPEHRLFERSALA